MSFGALVLLGLAAILFALAAVKRRAGIPEALRSAGDQILMVMIRMPLALVSAVFVGELIPPDAIAPLIGPQSGLTGIVLAMAFGAILPGGPILTFPLALVVWRAGAGEPQMITLLTSWSIFAVHRVLSYELPLLGARFVALRMASSWALPLVAGALTVLTLLLTGNDVTPPRGG